MSKEFREIIECTDKEEIGSLILKNLTVEELNVFLKILDSFNRELESQFIKKNELTFLKKSTLNFILKRTWISLEEKDKQQLADFFYSINDYIFKI